MEIYRIYLPIYFIVFIFVCFLWRWLIFYRRTGKNPVVIGSSESPHGYVALWLKIMTAFIAADIGLFVLRPELFESGIFQLWDLPPWIPFVGMGFHFLAVVISAVAQANMGISWRIGMDTLEKTPIVKTGLYRYSRNPIYVGMLSAVIGLFLIVPNTFSFVLLALTYVLLQITIRLEESHLTQLHGEPYRQFLKDVRRWV